MYLCCVDDPFDDGLDPVVECAAGQPAATAAPPVLSLRLDGKGGGGLQRSVQLTVLWIRIRIEELCGSGSGLVM